MSYVPPPQPPLKSPSDNTGAVVAAAGVSTGIMAVIVLAAVAVLFFALCVVGILIALLLPAINAAREAARRNGSMNNVRQIALAMVNYETSHGHFPPQFTVDAAGQPLQSWRTLILPFLEEQSLHDRIDQTQAWDSPKNGVATDTELSAYRSPRYDERGNLTNYVAIAGDGFLFNGDKKVSMSDVVDGLVNTMFVVEIANSDIAWAEPRDLTLDQLQTEDTGASRDAVNVVRSLAIVGFADGHVQAIQMADPATLRPLLTISGNEPAQPW